ncbi:unnamed protein product [Thlaspi arvense]|uniref:Protein kinase domain-containing protein n=1 Tax=Thlaspi arvense TaxID=13288 RepID=A0AAU9SDR3_THLAR|nr:unnamed protein product [Thlaspi arvense]
MVVMKITMKNPSFLFSFVSFLLLCFSTCSLSSEPRNPEVEALINIKNDLHDPHGVLNNWDEFSVDPCSWTMITCSADNLVIGLGAPSQSLSGTLSGSIGNLTNLRQVLLQNNNISGKIPPELCSLPKLQTLDLSNNRFSGEIPGSVNQLSSLQYLRLNNNSLSGPFPASLSEIPHLSFLDLSYNNLRGPVPKFPARTFNVAGNPLICKTGPPEICSGSINPSPLSVSLSSSSGRRTNILAVALGVSLGFAVSVILSLGFIWYRKKQRRLMILRTSDKQEEGLLGLGNLRSFTFRELHVATDGFSSKNILGAGGFGNVYRGKLGDGTMVAVKRLKDVNGASGNSQFRTELQMISLAVHRNLLRLIGYCASSNERLLVYPYMSNGSVRKLHKEMKVEELVDRELATNYDRIEVGEMLQVALLCTQFLPAHRPKMSEVVQMLEGDGLAERWAASHDHSHFYHANISYRSISSTDANGNNQTKHLFGSSGFDDEDDQALDSFAMELSGPR